MRTTLLHIDAVSPDRANPNCRLSYDGIDDLAASIAEAGQLQPIGVRPDAANPQHYLIVFGHRRYYAVRQLAKSHKDMLGYKGLQHIAAVIIRQDCNALTISQLRLIENLHQQKMSAIEIALELSSIKSRDGIANAQLAKLVGLSESSVSRYLIINDLDASTIQRIKDEKIRWQDAVDAVIAMRRIRKGNRNASRDAARGRPIGLHPAIFPKDHPLADKARSRCIREGHHVTPEHATACASCFETEIRANERIKTRDQMHIPSGLPPADLVVTKIASGRPLTASVRG
jgi:ParB/RepB/Spo0J family partition protein